MTPARQQPTPAVAEACRIQAEAADPASSIVLRAAAGSGKTKVLIDRFVRICLEGCPVKAILAVTFTRKAATEIKARLMDRATRFARLDEEGLRTELRDLLGAEPTVDHLVRAAGLYEEILEDTAGLNVGTIHQFCQVVLNRFAAEAGLDPRYSVLEKEDELWDEAFEALEAEAARDEAARRELSLLADRPSGLRRRLQAVARDRVHLERWLQRLGRQAADARDDAPADGSGEVAGNANPLALPRSPLLPLMLAELRAELFAGTDLAGEEEPSAKEIVGRLAAALDEFATAGLASVTAAETEGLTKKFPQWRDKTAALARGLAERLRAGGTSTEMDGCFTEAARLFLTGGDLRKPTGKKVTRDERLTAFAVAARPALEALDLAERLRLQRLNAALLRFGLRALDLYAGLKRRDHCVDFQDLELLAWRLMRDPERGLYIQYRLDESLRHLLVDEFQDTNFNQWEILQPFVDEFLAGDPERTVFFVGDVKQSIYRFRGAEPRLFGQVARLLTGREHAAVLGLPTNFRSAPEVVGTVGELFSAEPLRSLLPPGEDQSVRQLCARGDTAGSASILRPLPEDGDESADQRAARAAAGIIERLAAEGNDYGDMLVLCRNRTRIAVYEQALRESRIPFVPAGRGQLALSREVQDILALLRWLCFPEDDLALATVLRSPLLRVSEEGLQAALGTRAAARCSLWRILRRDEAAARLGLADAAGQLGGWLGRVGRESCHELLRRIYRESAAPERFAAALGRQAEFNLLRLHDLALSPELGAAPTLRAFVDLIQRAARRATEEEAVLPGERDRGRVGLMTVHGAKGLQRRIVLLVDADAPPRETPSSLALRPESSDGPKLHGVQSRHLRGPCDAWDRPVVPPILGDAASAALAEARREETNILYVALTRAEDHLRVLGGEQGRKGDRHSVLDWLVAGAEAVGDNPHFTLDAEPDDPVAAPAEPGSTAAATGSVTACRVWTPPDLGPGPRLVSPSELGGDRDGPGDAPAEPESRVPASPEEQAARAEALDHGNAVHLWLQRAAETGSLPPGEGRARQEAAEVLANPDLDWVFRPGGEVDARCEVSILHRLPASGAEPSGEIRVSGSIDRLLIGPRHIDIIDYKTNRVAAGDLPALCEHYRPQLEAYRRAIEALFPGRPVRTWLLLTHPSAAAGRGLLRET